MYCLISLRIVWGDYYYINRFFQLNLIYLFKFHKHFLHSRTGYSYIFLLAFFILLLQSRRIPLTVFNNLI